MTGYEDLLALNFSCFLFLSVMRDKEQTLSFRFLKFFYITSTQMDSEDPLPGYTSFKQLKRT